MKKFFILLFIFILAAGNMFAAEPYTVTANSLNVRDRASAKGKLIGTLVKGTTVDVIDTEGDFGVFEFLGQRGYASLKFLKRVNQSAETSRNMEENGSKTAVEETPVSNSTATVYLFFDSKHYFAQFPIDINGVHAFDMEGEKSVSKMTGTRYEKSYRKVTIHGEGKVVMSYDVLFAQKPYHNSITFDVSDGEVYYIRLGLDNIFNAIAHKRSSWEFKILSPKEGEKKLKDKKFTVNPPVEFTL